MDEVTPDDWEKVSGWKITSLVWTSLDAGILDDGWEGSHCTRYNNMKSDSERKQGGFGVGSTIRHSQ
jgi:hypothetical protein